MLFGLFMLLCFFATYDAWCTSSVRRAGGGRSAVGFGSSNLWGQQSVLHSSGWMAEVTAVLRAVSPSVCFCSEEYSPETSTEPKIYVFAFLSPPPTCTLSTVPFDIGLPALSKGACAAVSRMLKMWLCFKGLVKPGAHCSPGWAGAKFHSFGCNE